MPDFTDEEMNRVFPPSAPPVCHWCGSIEHATDICPYSGADRMYEEPTAPPAVEIGVHCEAILGPAGTGKSYQLSERLRQDAKYAVLTATTGIAAINLGEGVTTIHSQLKFYDLDSMRRSLSEGWLKWGIINLALAGYRNLVIDEISMFNSEQLDFVYQAFIEAAQYIAQKKYEGLSTRYESVQLPGFIVTGDFCQLPPVEGKYAFHAKCWGHFENNMQKLTINYRQTNPLFIRALQAAREGKGVEATMALKRAGVNMRAGDPDAYFDGTTLFPVNSQVDNFNRDRLLALSGQEIHYHAERWGKQRGEWKDIPEDLVVKPGALVMVLANEPKTFRYVNGDLAEVLPVADATERVWETVERKDGSPVRVPIEMPKTFHLINDMPLPLKIRRNGHLTGLPKVIRQNFSGKGPGGETDTRGDWTGPEFSPTMSPDWWQQYFDYIETHQMVGTPYFEPLKNQWVLGEIRYLPVRLGWASTVHKSQGLTLDTVQIDARGLMAGKPGLMYVALSRCRTPENIHMIGHPGVISRRIVSAMDVRRWF